MPVVIPRGGWSMLLDVTGFGARRPGGLQAPHGARSGRGHADGQLGQRARGPLRPLRVRERACRAPHGIPCAPGRRAAPVTRLTGSPSAEFLCRLFRVWAKWGVAETRAGLGCSRGSGPRRTPVLFDGLRPVGGPGPSEDDPATGLGHAARRGLALRGSPDHPRPRRPASREPCVARRSRPIPQSHPPGPALADPTRGLWSCRPRGSGA